MSESVSQTKPHSIVLRQTARWLTADTETPISLFLRLCNQGYGLLLESAEVDGRWGRYSVLACDVALHVECLDGKLCLHIHQSPHAETLAGLQRFDGLPFVDGLRQLMQTLEIEKPTMDLPPITRALYGYLGYGMVRLFNPKLTDCMPLQEAKSCLVLPQTVYLFDHLYNRLCHISLNPNEVQDFDALQCNHGQPIQTTQTLPAFDENAVTAIPGQDGYMQAVENIKSALRQGEAIQVVPSCRFRVPFRGNPFTLYRKMRLINPSPYMFYMHLPNAAQESFTLFGSSPEAMVRCTANTLHLSPIAGTRKRSINEEEDALLAADLQQDPKERAEHVMLVDLGRNDLGKIATQGSVKVEKLMTVERFSHVMHLTSHLTARLRSDLDVLDVLAATFPAGTVSGAPKIRAMEIIAQTEQIPRGPYAGCIGWFGLDNDSVNLDTGITIRSMWLQDGILNWQAGGGIVHDSDPVAEWQEVLNKSAIMRLILGA